MLNSPIASAKQFKRDEKGGVAILFGLSAVAIAMFAGLAIDLGRTYASKEKIAAAIDAATLAAAKGMRLEGLDETQATQLAQSVFDENMRQGAGRWTDINSVNITVNKANSTANMVVDATVKTTFGAIAGIQRMGSPGDAAAVFESRDIEVAVQLDMTGSMKGQKIKDLKSATTSLVDILLVKKPVGQNVKVAFAPFAAGVNAGSYLKAVNDDRSSVNNCVYERISPANEATDAPPSGPDAYKIRADLPTPPWPYAIQNCPKATIVPLTDKVQTLTDSIGAFEANGTTAGQLGAAWAWNLISSKWKDIWPTGSKPANENGDTDKIVILMTDGVYNTIGGVNWGDNSAEAAKAREMSVDLCTGMKNAGITVYTVGFMLDNADATKTLKDCAGKKGADPTFYFFEAENGAALDAAFKSIASSIMRLRLTN
jgi:Flp pilus assembly protein TadG